MNPNLQYVKIGGLQLVSPNLVDQKDRRGRTGLHDISKIQEANPEDMKFWINLSKNVNAQDDNGITPLHVACAYNNIKAIELLLDKGADVNKQTHEGGFTPLHLAVLLDQDKKMKQLLLAKGADKSIKDKEGFTAKDLINKVKEDDIVRKAWKEKFGYLPPQRFSVSSIVFKRYD
jgi:ankyrin repeat protein